jgi:AsmA protein
MQLSTRIWIGVGAGLAALTAVPFLLPLDVYRAPIEQAATAALGREVHIKGSLRLSVYPQLGLSLSDVTVANVPGAREPDMAAIGSVLIGAKLLPLLSRRLEITEVVLEHPVLRLEVNEKGEPNWNSRPAPSGQRPPQGQTESTLLPFNVISVENGEVSFSSLRANKPEVFSEIGIRMVLQRGGRPRPLNAPLNIAGHVTYNGENLKIDAKIDRFAAMMEGRSTPMHVGVASSIMNADFNGSLGTEGHLSGALKLGARSVRSFAAWMGHPMPPGNGFGLIAIDGQFSADDGVYSISHAQVAFDSMNMGTDISIDTKGTVPSIKGIVSTNKLDITPYLAPGREIDTVKATRANAAAARDTPLEFGWLKAANADMKLVVGELVTPALKLDQVVMGVALKNGVLKADTTSLSAYGGSGKASVSLDTSGEIPRLRQTLEVDGLKAQPLLTDMLGLSHISGTGAFRMEISTSGDSEAALAKALNGRGLLRLTGGAFTGVNLAAAGRVMQSVVTAEALTSAVGPQARTEFERMGGTFTIKDGVLTTNDLALVSPAVEITGKGSADMAARTLDFRFAPRARGGIPGLKLADFGLPFYVRGSWDKPSYGPDAKALPKTILDKLGEDASIPGELIKDPGNALRTLLGAGGR